MMILSYPLDDSTVSSCGISSCLSYISAWVRDQSSVNIGLLTTSPPYAHLFSTVSEHLKPTFLNMLFYSLSCLASQLLQCPTNKTTSMAFKPWSAKKHTGHSTFYIIALPSSYFLHQVQSSDTHRVVSSTGPTWTSSSMSTIHPTHLSSANKRVRGSLHHTEKDPKQVPHYTKSYWRWLLEII